LKSLRPHPLAVALLVAFGVAAPALHAADATPAVAPASLGGQAAVPGLDLSGMDAKVRPADDLFLAMNGQWIGKTSIPADKSDYGVFTILADVSDQRVRDIVEALAKTRHAAGSVDQKIGDFYASYVDTAAIDKAGLAPVMGELKAVDAVKDAKSFAELMGRWQGFIAVPLAIGANQDFKDPTIYIAGAIQGGLGLPDRDYYLKDTESFLKARAAYLAYVTRLFELTGDGDAAAHAASVIALETKIAAVQWAAEDNRDPQKAYNPTRIAVLQKEAGGIDWRTLLRAGQLPLVHDELVVFQPSYVRGLAALMKSEPMATWKLYLKVRLLDGVAHELPAAFREARFAYAGRALRGAAEDLPRWQKAVGQLNGAMGEALGQVYVQQNFPPASKRRMQELVNNLLATYSTSIDELAWMSPTTKKAAHEKLAKYGTKIGYPDAWRDYSKLVVKAGDPVGNDLRASRFEYLRQAVRVGHKVDRAEWGMTPQTVNAYYDPTMNEIVFPAAILQPPFFDMAADDAVNYGAIGAIIGHEISHGFDDEGSQFDGDGKLRNWWTDDDRKAFDAITSKLVDQYAGYEPIKGSHINGKLTLGENIADLSGLQIAYKAWKLSLKGQPAPVIGGLTGEQRFFLAWSQAWRSKIRDEYQLELLTKNPHSPDEFRANGAAVNTDAFHAAFGTRPGDAMWKAPEQRIKLW